MQKVTFTTEEGRSLTIEVTDYRINLDGGNDEWSGRVIDDRTGEVVEIPEERIQWELWKAYEHLTLEATARAV